MSLTNKVAGKTNPFLGDKEEHPTSISWATGELCIFPTLDWTKQVFEMCFLEVSREIMGPVFPLLLSLS